MDYQCKICLNTQNNIPFTGREMMFGTRDEFTYAKCSVCDCLQIIEIPDNLEKYYPPNYYSYRLRKFNVFTLIANALFRTSIRIQLEKVFPVYVLSLKHKKYHQYNKLWLRQVNKASSILDVGCGRGDLLELLHLYGFKNLTGIDPFIDKDTVCANDVKIYKQDIYEVNEQYDFVMLHHSLEHMPDPHRVFSQLAKMITDDGRILIRIPVVDGYAWRKYQMDWFQVDAPRHLFLYTEKSIRILAETYGLILDSIQYDSTYAQFTISEQYSRNIPLCETTKQTIRKQKYMLKRYAKKLNLRNDGDQACFILTKKG